MKGEHWNWSNSNTSYVVTIGAAATLAAITYLYQRIAVAGRVNKAKQDIKEIVAIVNIAMTTSDIAIGHINANIIQQQQATAQQATAQQALENLVKTKAEICAQSELARNEADNAVSEIKSPYAWYGSVKSAATALLNRVTEHKNRAIKATLRAMNAIAEISQSEISAKIQSVTAGIADEGKLESNVILALKYAKQLLIKVMALNPVQIPDLDLKNVVKEKLNDLPQNLK